MFELNRLYNMDCMDGMKKIPDGYFELAITDPPYGIERLKRDKGRIADNYGATSKANNNVPKREYFNELFRVSKNQIIWGGNYFLLPPCRCFIVWYKHQPVNDYSDCEFAWTSLNKPARVFDYPFFGAVGAEEARFHPTQKPVKLYEWILSRYAQPGDRILDTHAGSASSLIACHNMGFDFLGFEIDKSYFEKAKRRLDAAQAQMRLEDYIGAKGRTL